MAVLAVAPCGVVQVYQHCRATCCLHHQGDEWWNKYLWNIRKLLSDYLVLEPRRQPFSYLLPWKPQIQQKWFFNKQHLWILNHIKALNGIMNLNDYSIKHTNFTYFTPCLDFPLLLTVYIKHLFLSLRLVSIRSFKQMWIERKNIWCHLTQMVPHEALKSYHNLIIFFQT
jgi:hypothetical protein